MIFYDAFSMGPLIKSSKIGKRVQFSLSLSTQKETRQQTPPPSNNGSRRHRHRASEGVRARLRATGEKMHETRPTRIYAHREQDGVRCVLSIIALFFLPYTRFGKSNIATSSDVVSPKLFLSTSLKTRQGLSCLGSSGSS